MAAVTLAGKAVITSHSKLRKTTKGSGPTHGGSYTAKAAISTTVIANLSTNAGLANVIVTDITWTPATPVPGDHIMFTAMVKNIGGAATPVATIVDCLFTVSDATMQPVGGRSWSDDNSNPLSSGTSRAQLANGGDNSGYVVAGSSGNYNVQAYVNGNNRFPEADRTNNYFNKPLAIGSIAATVPTSPQNLAASPGDNTVLLSWDFPASNGGSIVTGYNLYRNGTLITSTPLDDAVITYNDTTVTNGATYTYTISALNSVGESAQSAGVTAIPSAATGAPALPANAIVGSPAYKVLFWGGWEQINQFQADYDNGKTAGFVGAEASGAGPTSYAADSIAGSGQQVSDTSVLGEADVASSNHQWQRGWEGAAAAGVTGAHAGGFWYQHNIDPTYEMYLGQYCSRANNTSKGFWPPFGTLPLTGSSPTQTNPDLREGSWWNDAYWVTAAAWYGKLGRAIKNVYFGSGIGFDTEPGNYTSTGSPTHTVAEHQQKTFDRAYQCGTAYFQNFPDGKIFNYQWDPVGAWGDWLRGWYYRGNTAAYPYSLGPNTVYAWHAGWVKAMCDFGGPQSRFTLMDRDFYQFGEGGMGQSVDSRSAKLKLSNERSMAYLTQDYPYGIGLASFSKGCDRIMLAPCSWPGYAGGSEKPNSTTASTWATQCAVDREWAMAPFRVVYAAGMGSAGGKQMSGLFYATYGGSGTTYGMLTTHLAGNQAAKSQTPIPTVLPTCTNLQWVGSTLTCRAAHKYGVKFVRVYNGAGFNLANPELSYLSAMQMTWMHPSLPDYVGTPGISGGNASASYPTLARVADSYQDCTLPTAGAPGTWRVLKVVSMKDDVAWFRVVHP